MHSFSLIFVLSLCYFVSGENLCDVCACFSSESVLLTSVVDCTYSNVSLSASYYRPESIITLDLSRSNISVIEKSDLLRSTSMKCLYLNDNGAVNISVDSLDLPSLEQLHLQNNKLKFIDKELFATTRNLKYLNLAGNLFTAFEMQTFAHLSLLDEIILDYNDIGKQLVEVNMFNLNGLSLHMGIRSISLKCVNLNRIPEMFLADAYNLRKLQLNGNNISTLVELDSTIQYLDLSDNPIQSLYLEDFSDKPALQELYLNNLQITKIEDYTFADLKSLTVLHLERNYNLTEFSRLAFGDEVLEDPDDFPLQELSLKGSRLRSLSEDLEVPLGRLARLDLQGNPWRCDCAIVWFKDLQISPDMYEHLRCGSPKPFYNSKIFELQRKYFMCERDHYLADVIGIVALCLTLVTVASWWLCFRKVPPVHYSVLHMKTVSIQSS